MFEILDRRTQSDRQPDQNPRRSHHRRRAGVLRLLPDRLRARLPDRAVEAHLRAVGHRADEFRHRRDHRRLCLGLARRPHRPAHGLHRHGAELLDRHRPAVFHAGQWLDLSHYHALLRRHRRRRALLRRPAAGAGIHALLQARLGRRAGDLRHPARRRPRRGAGRLHGQPTNGGCCLRSACCRRCWCSWSGSGCRRARAGCAARAATRKRASRSPGRCRWSRRPCRCRPRPTPARSSRRTGSICSNTRAACWSPGSAMPARRPASTASRSGRRRCSCCS